MKKNLCITTTKKISRKKNCQYIIFPGFRSARECMDFLTMLYT